MLHRRISYAALLVAAVFFQIFFKYYLSTFTLVLVVLLPVLSVLLSLPALLGTALYLTPEGNVPRGSEGRFTLALERKHTLPLPYRVHHLRSLRETRSFREARSLHEMRSFREARSLHGFPCFLRRHKEIVLRPLKLVLLIGKQADASLYSFP